MKKRKRKALKRHNTPIAKLRVMADHGSSGIWVIEPTGPFRHYGVGNARLALSQDLADRFEHWIGTYELLLTAPEEFDYRAFNAEGRLLAESLKQHVGSATYVEFQAETAEGGLCESEEIL